MHGDSVNGEPDSLFQGLDPEAAQSALDELFMLARRYRSSREYLELMRFVAEFRRYSLFNAMLVHI